jgi:glycosyltransferase involved in cell wall biosynthesis
MTLDMTVNSDNDIQYKSIQSLSFVIPCLSDAETIGSWVSSAKKLLARFSFPGEVIVADNNSTDESNYTVADWHLKQLAQKNLSVWSDITWNKIQWLNIMRAEIC